MSLLLTQKPKKLIRYTLRDEFTTDRAAGSVHGTNAEPGPSTRTVVDTENKLSIAGQRLSFGKKASSTYGDPGLWLDTEVTRAAGRMLVASFRLTTVSAVMFGFDIDKSGAFGGHSLFPNTTTKLTCYNGNKAPTIGASLATDTAYYGTVILRASGADYFIRGGVYEPTEFLFRHNLVNTATLYAGLCGYTGIGTLNYLRIPATLWQPRPLASDSFVRADGALGNTDGLGHAEGATALGSGGSGLAWASSKGTWAVATGKAACSALSDSVGIATVDINTADVYFEQVTVTRSAGNVGLVMRYVDVDNYIYAMWDGTNCSLVKRVAGSETTVITGTPAAGSGVLSAAMSGTMAYLWWNKDSVGSPTAIADAALQTSTKHGLYTTDTGATFDDAVLFARR